MFAESGVAKLEIRNRSIFIGNLLFRGWIFLLICFFHVNFSEVLLEIYHSHRPCRCPAVNDAPTSVATSSSEGDEVVSVFPPVFSSHSTHWPMLAGPLDWSRDIREAFKKDPGMPRLVHAYSRLECLFLLAQFLVFATIKQSNK